MDSFDKPQCPNSKGLSKNTIPKRVHNRVHNSEVCPELEQIITAWPELPEQVKDTIKKLIKKYSSKGKDDGKQ